jgi:hypothetical protein
MMSRNGKRRETSKKIEERSLAQTETIVNLKTQLKETETKQEEIEGAKADLEYSLRDERYNSQILTNRLTTIDTEMDLYKA